MRSKDMALDYMERALRCLEEAELAFSKNDYAGTVRRSQEALELASKAILRISGIEYPREHDVSPVLEAERDRLPNPIIENLEAIIKLSSELASLRGPAMYGYEREGIPAREAFKKDYSLEVLTEVKKLVEIMRKALYDVLQI
jgi:HEPN domain-containing protein